MYFENIPDGISENQTECLERLSIYLEYKNPALLLKEKVLPEHNRDEGFVYLPLYHKTNDDIVLEIYIYEHSAVICLSNSMAHWHFDAAEAGDRHWIGDCVELIKGIISGRYSIENTYIAGKPVKSKIYMMTEGGKRQLISYIRNFLFSNPLRKRTVSYYQISFLE